MEHSGAIYVLVTWCRRRWIGRDDALSLGRWCHAQQESPLDVGMSRAAGQKQPGQKMSSWNFFCLAWESRWKNVKERVFQSLHSDQGSPTATTQTTLVVIFFHFRLTHASCLVVLSLLNWPTLQNPGFNTRFQQDFGSVSIPTVPFFIFFLLMHVPLLQEAEKKNGPADQPEIALGI